MTTSTSTRIRNLFGDAPAFFSVYRLLTLTGLLLSSLLMASSALGQTTWQARYSGPRGSSENKAMKLDGEGNVLVSGSSLAADGYTDFTTIKYDGNNSHQLWEAHYSGESTDLGQQVHDMAVDAAGNVVVMGTINKGDGIINMVIVKYDGKTGRQLWLARYQRWLDRAAAMALDASGNVYITGTANISIISKIQQAGHIVLKYHGSNGEQVWQVIAQGSKGKALALDGSGYMYVLGTSGENSTFKHTYTKYETGTGNYLWRKEYANTGEVELKTITIDTKKNMYVGGQRVSPSPSARSFILLKYAPNGDLLWNKEVEAHMMYPGEVLKQLNVSVGVDKADNVFLAGRVIRSTTDSYYATIKYATDGRQLWQARYQIEPDFLNNLFQAMVVDAANNVYITTTTKPAGGLKGYTTVKYSGADGQRLWKARYQGTGNSEAKAIALDSQGNAYVSGTNQDNGKSILTLKYDANGLPSLPAVYLSDLTWTSMINGWGPAEKDRSNGEAGPMDGTTITLNGKTYRKGLGVHANSEIRYSLAGAYTTFISDIGVDDEVGTNGSVIFHVYLDGKLAYQSGLMTGSTATKTFSLDVRGKTNLLVRVSDGTNGNSSDHADWADARLIPAATTTATARMDYQEQPIASKEALEMRVYPVPAQEEFHVSFMADSKSEAMITLYDMVGRQVGRLVKAVATGEITISLPIQHLPKGMYVLTLSQGTQNVSKKVIISR